MAQQITFTCDECRRPKGEANHWWLWSELDGALLFTEWGNASALPPDREHGHLCGPGCANKKLSSFMEAK